jgi:hypothetical protein
MPSFNTSGSTSTAVNLDAIIGTGTETMLLQNFSDSSAGTSITFTQSFITYNFTPVPGPIAGAGLPGQLLQASAGSAGGDAREQ